MKLFNIIVPVFNESNKINNFINSFYDSQISKNKNFGKLILINDGSTDNTIIFLNQIRDENIIIINLKKNKGYGNAIKEGINYSKKKSEYVIFIDSDLTNPIKDIYKIIPNMRLKIDLIKGNRFHHNGGINKLPLKRRFFTKYGNIISRIFFNLYIKDCTNGFRAVKTELYEKINLQENDFSIIPEELYQLKPVIQNISEFNTTIGQRDQNQSSSSFNYSLNLIYKYLKYSFLASLYLNKKLRYR